MDNASKALIMAGAILISVAIVGIGIYIFSVAKVPAGDAISQIDDLAIVPVNSRIEFFCGKGVRGSQVTQLVNAINSINSENTMPHDIVISGTGISGSPDKYISNTKNNDKYNVEASYANNGYISTITVSQD